MTLQSNLPMRCTKMETSSLHFINKLIRKDIGAFEELYNNYSSALFGHIRQLVNDSPTAEDILQVSFINIWRGIDQYDSSKATIFTWMLNICRNEVVNHYRNTSCFKRTISDEYSRWTKSSNAMSISARMDLHAMVLRLPHRDRVVIEMIYFKGFTMAETATLLNLPIGTLKTRVRSVLQKWRKTVDLCD